MEQLLSLAQPEPVNYESTNIHRVIDDTLAFLSTELSRKSIEIVKNYMKEAPKVYAAQDRLKQVFLTVFLNGIESMDDRGTLVINTSYDRKDKGGLISKAGELVIEIKDTGRGIPPEILPKIFDPFFSTKENGTGLGLSVAHQIVAYHGGSIEVKETAVGKGTCFSLRFPVYREGSKEEGWPVSLLCRVRLKQPDN